MDLSWVCPQPTPVALGDRVFLILPLRLRDVAALQGYVRARVPNPLEAARPALSAAPAGSAERRKLLREAYLATENWPPRYGSDAADAIFLDASGDGVAYFVGRCLASSGIDVSRAELDAVLGTMSVDQLVTLTRTAFAADPLDELSRLIAREIDQVEDLDDDDAGEDLNWAEAFRELADETGWTFDEIGAMRMTQWVAYRSKGKNRALRPRRARTSTAGPNGGGGSSLASSITRRRPAMSVTEEEIYRIIAKVEGQDKVEQLAKQIDQEEQALAKLITSLENLGAPQAQGHPAHDASRSVDRQPQQRTQGRTDPDRGLGRRARQVRQRAFADRLHGRRCRLRDSRPAK